MALNSPTISWCSKSSVCGQTFVFPGNVAYGKTASSSAFDNKLGLGPSKAIDGGVNQDIDRGGECFHSADNPEYDYEWWMVDLGSVYQITNVTINNEESGKYTLYVILSLKLLAYTCSLCLTDLFTIKCIDTIKTKTHIYKV